MSNETPYCCYIEPAEAPGHPMPCRNDAEWEIENPFSPPDVATTQACTEHVGHLLEGAPICYVTPLE